MAINHVSVDFEVPSEVLVTDSLAAGDGDAFEHRNFFCHPDLHVGWLRW